MRLSIIITISTAIYFAANTIHAVPIPSCKGNAGDYAPSFSGAVLSPEARKVNLGAVTHSSTGENSSTDLRRRNMNNKRGEKPATGPLSGKLEGAQGSINSITAPATGELSGHTTSIGMIATGVGGLASPPTAQQFDPNVQLAKANAHISGVTKGVEGAAGIFKAGAGSSTETKGEGQG